MNIYFIRHGDPDYKNDCITELGIEQAKKLAESIKNLKIDEVYQSPMGRAVQTASYSVEKWNKTPVTLDWLKELVWGDASGDAYSTASPWSIRSSMLHNDHAYPKGDDWKTHPALKNDRLVDDIESRTVLLDDFLKMQGYEREGQLYKAVNPNSKNIAFFCHSGLSSALLAYLLNIPFWQFITHIDLELTSVSVIHLPDEKGYGAATAKVINDAHHLHQN